MRGGHANSGPPPDPDALRRDRPTDQAGWLTLPAEGRQGDPPSWPLTRASARELVKWTEVWALPQAVMWEEQRQHDQVALYIRALVAAEKPKAPVAARALVARLAEELGVSLPGMARRRWRIATTTARPTARTHDPDHDERKARLRALEGGARSA